MKKQILSSFIGLLPLVVSANTGSQFFSFSFEKPSVGQSRKNITPTRGRVPASAVAFFRGQHYVIKKHEDKLTPVLVKILDEGSEQLWISSEDSTPLHSGDLILTKETVLILPRLLQTQKD